jgi:hypothetical protein
MISSSDPDWSPSPELLAAYFDGEFEGRDELAALRQRLEDWLAVNPAGRTELADYRRLRRLWLETTPAGPAHWRNVQRRLEQYQGKITWLPGAVRAKSPWKPSDLLVGVACVLLAVLVFRQFTVIPVDDAPFPVASEREVVILQVDGADTATLVVGELPVQGPLELAGPGDVTLTRVEPAERDNMVPEVQIDGPRPPIIWARAAAEEN